MLGIRPRMRSIARDARGFTLPELLVATVLSLVVIGGAVMAFTSSMNDQPKLSSQAAGIQQARTTMEQITRELRQGSSLTGDLTAARLSIEENANFKGKVDLVQNSQKTPQTAEKR